MRYISVTVFENSLPHIVGKRLLTFSETNSTNDDANINFKIRNVVNSTSKTFTFELPPEKKSGGVKSGLLGVHGRRPPNDSFRKFFLRHSKIYHESTMLATQHDNCISLQCAAFSLISYLGMLHLKL